MAISDTVKVDRLWKKFFGTTKTADGSIKFASNETIPSISPVLPDQLWGQASLIPDVAPAVPDSVVDVFAGATAIRMTNDPTSPVNVAWLATEDYGDTDSRMADFIPATFGSTYAAKVWIGDPSVGPAARIFPDATGEAWVWDAAAGVLSFDEAIPSSKTATVGSGTVTVAANGIYIEVCRYIGTRFPTVPQSLGELDDVDLSTAAAKDGDVLTYEDGVWQPKTPEAPAQSLEELTDVDFSTAAASDGDVLTLKDGVWIAKTPEASGAETLEELSDVDFSSAAPVDGDVLTRKDGAWIAQTPEASGAETLEELSDVDFSSAAPVDGDVLTRKDGAWIAMTPEPAVGDGFQIPLGDVANEGDGSWAPGAVPLTDNTPVSEAVDRINEVLGKLVPAQPPAFPNATSLTISNAAGSSPRLASGVTDNSGASTLNAGDAVTRVAAATISTNTFNDVGPGDSGTVEFIINNNIVGQRALTGSGDNGNYNGLVIADQKDYPVLTPGFWKSLDISGLTVAGSQVGVNATIIQHSAASNTGYVFYVRDDLNTAPTISSASVVEETQGTLAYSSSIPHYNTGAQLAVNLSISNLAGQTYYGGTDPLVISGTNSIITADTKTYANLSISTPIAAGTTTATAVSEQIVDIDGSNVHNSGLIQGVAKNVAGSSTTTTLSSTAILVKRGTAGSRLDELSIPVSGLGSSPNGNNAVRVGTASGDKPSLTNSAWTSSSAIASHDATVVGGVLKHDQANYSTGFLPVGPDLSSGRSGAQYATFKFSRTALSAFKINITGSYAGVWIGLPGVSDAQPNGGGWWDMFKPYDGAGIPGESGDTDAGCALGTVMAGGSGTYQVTFGTASSTSATNNDILVHIRLNAGQSISALSFTN